MKTLARFGVSIDTLLLREFDSFLKRSGYENRSEAFRDLIRARLAQEKIEDAEVHALGVLSIVYDHHQRELERKLNDIQHQFHSLIISTTHAHLDHDSCLEVILLRGKAGDLRKISAALGNLKGVKHANLALTTGERI